MEKEKICKQHVCRTSREIRLYPVFLVLVNQTICLKCNSIREATYKLINRDNIRDMRGVKDSGRLNLQNEEFPQTPLGEDG